MDVVFVISHLPDSRYKKRFEVLKDKWETAVIYWNKQVHQNNALVNFDIPSVRIDIEANRTSPIKRIPQLMKFSNRALASLKEQKPKCIYVGNIDMLEIACRYKKLDPSVKIIYEIADLHRYIADIPGNPLKKILRSSLIATEKKLIQEVDLLVLTSWKFFDTYYCNLISRDKVILLPNMPLREDFASYQKKSEGPFTVGFIGAIRYQEQLKMLIRAGKRAGVNVLYAGASTDDEIEELCKENQDYCQFLGAFNYTKEIANLYGKLDCVYSVYDADMANVRVALPNKLYESIICRLPLIVAKNTYLSELTEGMGIGVSVSHKDEDELVRILMRLRDDREWYQSIVDHCTDNMDKVDLPSYTAALCSRISSFIG